MTDLAERRTLLQELDARQDDVLQQLDELNTRVESLLKNWLTARDRGAASGAPD